MNEADMLGIDVTDITLADLLDAIEPIVSRGAVAEVAFTDTATGEPLIYLITRMPPDRAAAHMAARRARSN